MNWAERTDTYSTLAGSPASAQSSRVCPEAYENVDQTNYVEPPAKVVGGVLIALVGLAVVLLGANVFLFLSSSKSLESTLEDISSIAE